MGLVFSNSNFFINKSSQGRKSVREKSTFFCKFSFITRLVPISIFFTIAKFSLYNYQLNTTNPFSLMKTGFSLFPYFHSEIPVFIAGNRVFIIGNRICLLAHCSTPHKIAVIKGLYVYTVCTTKIVTYSSSCSNNSPTEGKKAITNKLK